MGKVACNASDVAFVDKLSGEIDQWHETQVG